MQMFGTTAVQSMEWLQWGAVIGASLAAAMIDIRRGLIPNALTFPLWLTGLAMAVYLDGLSGLGTAISVSVVLALPYIVLALLANGGAGDAKLMGAIGAWLSMQEGLVVLCCVAVTGMVLAILRILLHRQRKALSLSVLTSFYTVMLACCSGLRGWRLVRTVVGESQTSDQQERVVMPYGVAIFIGVCIAAIGAGTWAG